MHEWYQKNYFKVNADKSCLFLGPYFNKEITIANCNTARSNSEEVLGVVIESEATFAKHIENICGRQIKIPCIDESSQRLDFRKVPLSYENIFLFFLFIFIKFNYCPLVRMCNRRKPKLQP